MGQRTTMTWKRLTAVAAAVVVGASVLAGCGSSTPAATPDANNASGGTFPTKVEHFFGAGSIEFLILTLVSFWPCQLRHSFRSSLSPSV